jgi:hypothetical protein
LHFIKEGAGAEKGTGAEEGTGADISVFPSFCIDDNSFIFFVNSSSETFGLLLNFLSIAFSLSVFSLKAKSE